MSEQPAFPRRSGASVNLDSLATIPLPELEKVDTQGDLAVATAVSCRMHAPRLSWMDIPGPSWLNVAGPSQSPVEQTETIMPPKRATVTTKKPLLRLVGVTRQADLTPQAKTLYRQAKELQRKTYGLEKRAFTYRKRLEMATRYSQTTSFMAITKNLTATVKDFFLSQIQNAIKKKKGRRFTINNKILALALYKRSPKAYKLLCSIFSLPSPGLLNNLLSRINLPPGICEPIFRTLKQTVLQMKQKDRCCILIFDEMSLLPHLQYSQHKDFVEGFADDGSHRSPEIADHVQVYMLRGIYKRWKQPVAYTFCKSGASAPDIVRYFKAIVREAFAIGLNVIASICDQAGNNGRAIQMLKEETKRNVLRSGEEQYHDIIRIDGNTIVPLFDPPHLLKSIRNNLLSKDLRFRMNNRVKVAKWSHIEDGYFIDVSAGKLRIMPKLTHSHVVPRKIRKMKVSVCSQVFSRTVASALALMSRDQSESVDGSRKMRPEARDTADLLLFFDELFDSVNGGFGNRAAGKHLRCLVAEKSHHLNIWNKSLEILQTMEYLPRKSKDQRYPAVLNNWIDTLRGFKLVQKTLQNLGFNVFPARAFNQDPLENFFGQVRQHGVRFVNPTCAAFGPYFKTLMVNNFATVHSPGSNCEADDCQSLLTLQQFITQGVAESAEPVQWQVSPPIPEGFRQDRPLEAAAVGYVSGFVAKNMLPIFQGCQTCLHNILHTGELSAAHEFVNVKDYGRDDENLSLKYCSVNFISSISLLYNYLIFLLPHTLHTPNLKYNLTIFLNKHVPFHFDTCEHTDTLVKTIVAEFSNIVLYHYCEKINHIMLGKEDIDTIADDLQTKALDIYNKRLKYRK